MPAALAAASRLAFAFSPGCFSHSTLPGTCANSRIQIAKTGRGDLPVGIEAAEDEGVFAAMARLGARRRRADGAAVVVGKVAGQQGQLFAESRRIGRDDAIGDDIVHERRGRGAGIAQPAGLNGCGPVAEDIEIIILWCGH